MHTANSIPLMKIVSSQIAAIGHDPATEVLAIQFLTRGQPGNVYHYRNFTAAEYSAFASAESAGAHFGKHIKPYGDKHPYQNMGVPAPAAPEPAPVALSKEMLAVALNGREYPFDLTKEEQAQAKAAGLLVIFGASDDLMELRGIDYDEIGAPGEALIDAKGLLPNRDNIEDDAALKDFFARQPLARKVEALWAVEDGTNWTYRTDIPHATFDVIEDGMVYCRGIVISVADLAPAAAAKIERDHAQALDINTRCYGKEMSGGQHYSRRTFKDNGDPILLTADGSRSVFCDLCDDMEDAA